jgi:hypothetical protein
MVHRESSQLTQEMEMEKLGREMFLAKDTSADLDLDQVMDFIQKVEDLTTSTFYNDLATIPNQDEILRHPAGIRSAMKKPGRKRLFLLLKRGRNHVDTILADVHGYPLDEARSRDSVMREIRCFPETPKATFETYPGEDDFDSWIEKTRRHWADKNDLDPGKLQVICALALVP